MLDTSSLPSSLEGFSAFIWPLAAISLISYVIYERFFSPLAGIPGPFWASLSKLWLVYKYNGFNYHKTAMKLHGTYGNLVRISPNEVSVGDPDAVKSIYGAQSKLLKGHWYSGIQPKKDFNLLGQMDFQRNKLGRQMIGPVYSLKSIRESEDYMHDSLETFVKNMREKKGQNVDVVQALNMIATGIESTSLPNPLWAHLQV